MRCKYGGKLILCLILMWPGYDYTGSSCLFFCNAARGFVERARHDPFSPGMPEILASICIRYPQLVPAWRYSYLVGSYRLV